MSLLSVHFIHLRSHDHLCYVIFQPSFAAGSITRAKSTYKTRWSHLPFDLHEVGSKLGDLVLHLVDPHHFHDVTPSTRIEFKQAKRVQAYLPGGLHYLQFAKPALPNDSPSPVREAEELAIDLFS